MNIRPIFSALLRHKTAAALIALEIALSCAIICNAVFIVGSRVKQMNRSSGIVENELVDIQVSSLTPDIDRDVMRRTDIAALSAIPGVKSVTSVNQIPYGGNVWSSGINLKPDQPEPTLSASQYMDDGRLLQTLGVRVVEGRAFTADEYEDESIRNKADNDGGVPTVIITRALATHLFHGESAVGKNIYVFNNSPTRIVGVIDNLVAPFGGRNPTGGDDSSDYDVMIFPTAVSNGEYVLRTEPARRAEVLKAAADALNRVDPNRIIGDRNPLTDMRHDFYSRDRAVVWLLLIVSLLLLLVTALGIVGLASFWVQQRTKQIGVRRALGATRGQILRYFQTENFLLSTLGIVIGMIGAFGINQLLMSHYELPRLPLLYLPMGALILWLLGQLAVLGPALRAASIPPATATRSV